MKNILNYLVFAVFCLGSYLSAQSEQTIRNSAVRVIRVDEMSRAIEKKKLPVSVTGFLVKKDREKDYGVIITHINVTKNGGGTLDKEGEYYVLMPVYNEKNEVIEVRAYRARLASPPDQRTNSAILNISPESGLPSVVKASETPVKRDDKLVMWGFRKYTNAEPNQIDEILRHLEALSHVAFDSYMKVDVKGVDKKASLMGYMGVSQVAYSASQISDDAEPCRRIVLNAYADSESFGCALVNKENFLVGMIAAENGSVATADDFDAINSLVKLATRDDVETQLPWLWIGVGAGVLLIIGGLVFVIAKESKKKDKRKRPVLMLQGEDGTRYELSSSDLHRGVSLGRSSKADNRFDHETVSRIHAKVSALENKVVIIDKDSKGGTFVNGERLTPGQPMKLHDGDVVTLAKYKITVQTLHYD